ncbi:hypothetical protein ZWY2020_058551 [Hordeum vulgare]|nr:hypothetical protein ZWY2020_058551 [Hordeum vulgare]
MPGLAAAEQDAVSLVHRVARALNRRISEEDALSILICLTWYSFECSNSGIIAMRCFVPDVLALSLQSVLAVHPATSSE